MSKPVRTLLYSTLYPSVARPIHGVFVETRLRELLQTGQVQTRVVAPVPWVPSALARSGPYMQMARTPARETRNGIEVLHPRYPLLPKIGMTTAPLLLALSSIRAIQGLIDEGFDFDVIDAHYYYPDGVAAALLARWFKKPLTITARGTDLNLIPEHALPKRMIHWAAQRADASIGVCAALMDVLRQWGIPDQQLHVMRNGVDLQRFSPQEPAQARQALAVAGAPVLLSVGHLIERKGHHLVVAAMPKVLAQFPQARLLIAGEGEERGRLTALIESLNLQASVTLVGAIANEKMAQWYSAADLMVLASSREGWANVLLEAMACGTPVVATRIWGTPEVITTDAVGVLVDERSSDGLASAMLSLLQNPRSRAAVRAYAEGFSWEQTSSKQLDLFRRLAAGAPRAVTHHA
jgi:teichuronic acid biosynthesis glycosyltransferase TuaC